ncbi:MAG: sigma-54 dependent transcriptional regulator [Pseudomonadota bacterium]
MSKILFVDDEKSMCEFFDILLSNEGYDSTSTTSGTKAIQLLANNDFDMVITDICMPEIDGFEILDKAKKIKSEIIVLMITAYASTESAIEAMKKGAYDYIMKPFKVDEIKIIIRNALEKATLAKENKALKKLVTDKFGYGNIIGDTPQIRTIFDTIDRIKDTKLSVLIAGESGTGKDLIARAIHFNSKFKNGPFVPVNCGAIPDNLIESELFGYVKGAFTGADTNKKGLFEAANNGTIFLDEVGELPNQTQVKLLRVLQEKKFIPIGGTYEISVDLRIISATNSDLKKDVSTNKFREDLFYRLKVVEIDLPPLRDRKPDIPILAEHFLKKYVRENNLKIIGFTPGAMQRLINYNYIGNIRELENIIERTIAFESTDKIQESSLPPEVQDALASNSNTIAGKKLFAKGTVDLDFELATLEESLIIEAMEKAKENKNKAAKLLNISHRSLRYRMQKLNMKDEENEN